MDKLMDPSQVRKAYLKAAAICHPDKVLNIEDPDKIYISNRCFAALTEAFNLYKVSILIVIKVYIERERNAVRKFESVN